MEFVQAIIDGLLIGGVYAVISIGLTLVYGVMGIVNFAQAEFLMIGMFVAWFAWAWLGLDPVLAAPLSFVVAFIIASHQQILNWLETLPFVDGKRMAFYGHSYGGETAVRVPPIVEKYALSICSGDFNQWIWKMTRNDDFSQEDQRCST